LINFRRLFCFNKDVSIISNNCGGADISHLRNLRFNSPIVNNGTLPCDFVKFCKNLDDYLSCDMVEIEHKSENLTPAQIEDMHYTYGGRNIEDLTDFPFAKVDDVVILLQHYKSFEEAQKKWYERRTRVNKDNICYFLFLNSSYPSVEREFIEWNTNKRNKALLIKNTNGYYNKRMENGTTIIDLPLPEGVHFMDRINKRTKYYEKYFNVNKWLNNCNKKA